jgi:hypothetical protein
MKRMRLRLTVSGLILVLGMAALVRALVLAGGIQFFRHPFDQPGEPVAVAAETTEDENTPRTAEPAIPFEVPQLPVLAVPGPKRIDTKRLIQKVLRDVPELGEALQKEAQKEFEAAEQLAQFGQLEQARSRYKAIVRRYPGTPCAELARERLEERKEQAEEDR